MSLGAYLNFNGNTRDAIAFYADAFHMELPRILTYGDAGPGSGPIPEAIKNLVMHASLPIAGGLLMFSDAPPDMRVSEGGMVSLYVALETADQVTEAFNKLSMGGVIITPLEETFFSKCYGALTDKFGVHWQLLLESAITPGS